MQPILYRLCKEIRFDLLPSLRHLAKDKSLPLVTHKVRKVANLSAMPGKGGSGGSLGSVLAVFALS